jgi:hypothetical protein
MTKALSVNVTVIKDEQSKLLTEMRLTLKEGMQKTLCKIKEEDCSQKLTQEPSRLTNN